MTAAVLIVAVLCGLAVLAGLAVLIERHVLERIRYEREDELARARYLTAWEACDGLPTRLRQLASVSESLAQGCRRAAQSRRRPVIPDGVDHWSALPRELARPDAPGGDPERWRALDRALTQLAAVHRDRDAARHADAHETVSIAAEALAADLDTAEDPGVDRCWFCDRGTDEISHLFASEHASICDACVQACHEQITGA